MFSVAYARADVCASVFWQVRAREIVPKCFLAGTSTPDMRKCLLANTHARRCAQVYYGRYTRANVLASVFWRVRIRDGVRKCSLTVTRARRYEQVFSAAYACENVCASVFWRVPAREGMRKRFFGGVRVREGVRKCFLADMRARTYGQMYSGEYTCAEVCASVFWLIYARGICKSVSWWHILLGYIQCPCDVRKFWFQGL